MQYPLSQNELMILDRQMAMVSRHLAEITSLLESRLGETNDMAITAKIIEAELAGLTEKVRSQATEAGEELSLASRSQSA